MSIVARFIGIEEVIEQFEKIDKANFSMWCKSQLICQYNGDDIIEAVEIITDEMNRNIKRRFGHECYLKIHPKQESNYTLKSETCYNIVFKSFDSPDYGSVDNRFNNSNNILIEKLNAIESRLAGLEEDEEDEEEIIQSNANDYAEKINGVVNSIGQLLNNPNLGLLLNKLFDKTPSYNVAPVKQLAGADNLSMEDQQKILAAALEKLFSKGVTLQHIVSMSEMPADKIKSLLLFL